MEVCGASFIAAAGSVPLAIPPAPLRGPLPPRKRWGARKYIGARSPPSLEQEWASKRSGGEIISPDHYKETRCLQLPIVPNEFGVCMVYGRCCTGYDGARQA